MGAAASTAVGVRLHINDTIDGVVRKVVTSKSGSDPKGTVSDSISTKSFKDRMRPVMLSQKTLKSFALKNHMKENMAYIPQDPIMNSFAIKAATTANASMRKINLTASGSNSNIQGPGGDNTPPKRAGIGLRLNLGLKLQVTEDESDWIQVSEDEDDDKLSPRRLKLGLPSIGNEPILAAKQSLMFTNSGTIFVDGFSEGIGKDGIQNRDGNSHFLITERLVLVCNLGQGASGTVYKALDLSEMRIVALKCISVFERGKRRQMVRELGALFEMLHSADFSPRSSTVSPRGEGGSKAVRSTTRTAVEFNDIVRRTSVCSDDGRKELSKNPKDHIVDFYDAFSNLEDGGVALMMEYMDGGSLQDIADAGGVDDEGTLASIAFQCLSGLQFLHKCNQIHRDIKPANILINHDGTVKISDLGILKKIDPIQNVCSKEQSEAKHLPTIHSMEIPLSPNNNEHNSSSTAVIYEETGEDVDVKIAVDVGVQGNTGILTTETVESDGKHLNIDEGEMFRANTFVGTVTYMAPERIDSRPYTFNSDVWSFGLTLLTVALGKLPIDNANGFWSVLNAIRDNPPPELPDDGTWSYEIRDFIKQCLTTSPVNRPSCSELLKHPFIKRAVPDNFEEDSQHIEERGKKEVRAIIHALHTHLVKLKADYSKLSASEKTDTSASATHHVLGQALEMHGVDEVLRLLVFGREPTKKGDDLLKDKKMSHRLSMLAKQLHLPMRTTLMEARAVCREILAMSRENSNASAVLDAMIVGYTTPSKDAMKSLEADDLPPVELVKVVPTRKHDHVPTPKARHDRR